MTKAGLLETGANVMVKYVSSIEQEQYGALWLEGEKWRSEVRCTYWDCGHKTACSYDELFKIHIIIISERYQTVGNVQWGIKYDLTCRIKQNMS